MDAMPSRRALQADEALSSNQSRLLEVDDLAFSYSAGHAVFEHVSFDLAPGEVMTILGKNGVGKSTLLDCIANLLDPRAGEVRLAGKSIRSMPIGEVAQQLAYVPQISALAFSYRVRDYVIMGCAPHMGVLKVPGSAQIAEADAVLDKLDISYLRGKHCTRLSGGEFQQVQIARALVQKPSIIMLDEPTNHLDYGNQLKILKLISDLSKEGIATVLTTHNPDHAIQLGGKVGIFSRDGVFEVGDVEEMVTEDRVRDIYRVPLHMVYVPEAQRIACVADGFVGKSIPNSCGVENGGADAG